MIIKNCTSQLKQISGIIPAKENAIFRISNLRFSSNNSILSNYNSLLKKNTGITTIKNNDSYYFIKSKEEKHEIISPWHDISLKNDSTHNTYNMIVEIPYLESKKLEMSKENEFIQ